jgi:ankyrin repeat protein
VAHSIDREVIQPRRIEDEDRRREGRKSESDEEPDRTERSRSQDSMSEHKDSDDESATDEGDPELNKEFIIACWKGESRRVDSLLRDGASYLARDRHGWTGLMWAASKGYDDIVENLVDRTENKRKRSKYVNAKDDITGWTALHVSTCYYCTLSYKSTFLLSLPGNDCFIRNMLQIACVKGQVKCIRQLVKLGANVDASNFLNETPVECLQCDNADDRMEIRHFLNERSSKKKTAVEGKSAD